MSDTVLIAGGLVATPLFVFCIFRFASAAWHRGKLDHFRRVKQLIDEEGER